MIPRIRTAIFKICYRLVWICLKGLTKSPKIEIIYQNRRQEEGKLVEDVVYRCNEPAYIDPDYGYIITEKGFLIEESMQSNFINNKSALRIGVPSPFKFLKYRKSFDKATAPFQFQSVISLRHLWEWNYYHFYFDALSKLELLEFVGVDTRQPIALGRYVDDVNFARTVLGSGDFANHQWLAPTDEYIRGESVLYCRTNRPYRNRVRFICNSMKIDGDSPLENHRIFLTRVGNRRLINLDELNPIFEKYQFKTIDAAEMSVQEQIDSFKNTRYLIANHGAGTTNIIYRGEHPLSVLELHSDKCVNYDHKRICDELDHFWDQLMGKANNDLWNVADYTISPVELEKKIIRLLEN